MKKSPNNLRSFLVANLTAPQISMVKNQLSDIYDISEVIIERDLAHHNIKKWRQKIWLDEIAKIFPRVAKEDLFPEVVEVAK